MARRNYKYGKMTDGTLTYAPLYLEHGGWKQINEAEYPQGEDEMVQYTPVCTEDETTIYVAWEAVPAENMEV